MNTIFIAGLFILLLGFILLIVIAKQRKRLGVLMKKRIYQDTQSKPGETMYSKTLNLVGKPDYLIQDKKIIIPVEVKTGKTPRSPYPNHTMQLMAYCLLVEENFGIRPPGGILKYPEKEFKIAFTKEAENSVRELAKEILQLKNEGKEINCSHAEHNI